jgi:hypothetical protein
MPAETLRVVNVRAIQMKQQAQGARDTMAAESVPSKTIIDVFLRLRGDRAAFDAAKAVPGLAAYAREQYDNPALDIVAEFNAMTSAIDNVTNWISTNFPKDGGGFLLAQTLGANGPVDRMFTPAQTAGLRTQLDALIATVV